MKPIIQKTEVVNVLGQGRKLHWAGLAGVFIGPRGTVVVDGAYPTACRSDACRKALMAELERGWTRISLITNVSVKPAEVPVVKEKITAEIKVKTEVSLAEKPKEVSLKKETTNEARTISLEMDEKVDEKSKPQEIFNQVSTTTTAPMVTVQIGPVAEVVKTEVVPIFADPKEGVKIEVIDLEQKKEIPVEGEKPKRRGGRPRIKKGEQNAVGTPA